MGVIRKLCLVVFLFPFFSALSAQEVNIPSGIQTDSTNHFPEPLGFVNDYSNLLPDSLENELETQLREYKDQTSREIVIVLIDSLGDYTNILQYGTDLGNTWGVGSHESDNGIVIVLALPLRKIGIAVGSGIVNIFTDAICKAIIDEIMIPRFKEDNFFFGLRAGINTIIGIWE